MSYIKADLTLKFAEQKNRSIKHLIPGSDMILKELMKGCILENIYRHN